LYPWRDLEVRAEQPSINYPILIKKGIDHMKILCIYGCGGMGREIADVADMTGDWENIIFVDDNAEEKVVNEFEVYTLEEAREKYCKNDLEFIVSAGEPESRKHIYNKLERQGLNCISIIAPGFILSRFSSVEKGTFIHRGVIGGVNTHIGKGCIVNKSAVIGHDVEISEYCVISPNVTIGGYVNIGPGCYIGSGAIIRNGINIGESSIIGMGAVVLHNVEPNSVMVGNPAKFLRENTDKKVFRKS
jgi:sugar O-acyltransferase (sialic acid O-acetyltransferase NeuD family)